MGNIIVESIVAILCPIEPAEKKQCLYINHSSRKYPLGEKFSGAEQGGGGVENSRTSGRYIHNEK